MSLLVDCDTNRPSILAVTGFLSDDVSSPLLTELLSVVAATTFGYCTVLTGGEVPPVFSQLAGFEARHAIVSDLVDANGDRLAIFVSVGMEENPSENHLLACQRYVEQIETSFDADTQRRFTHATSVALRDRETKWQRRVTDLKTANSELDRMASYAAHEFRTPLRSVMFDAEYLAFRLNQVKNGGETVSAPTGKMMSLPAATVAEMSTFVQRIYDQTSYLATQLDHLLVVARSDNKSPLMEMIDMAELVADTLYRHRSDIAEVGASVDFGLMPTVCSNGQFMSIVLSNLIANAIRFRSPDRRLRIQISSERYDSGVLLSISDNGIGIDEQHHDRIFGPFDRLDESAEGLGLGLSLCTKLLERLGAELLVDSELGEGAQFTVKLPQP